MLETDTAFAKASEAASPIPVVSTLITQNITPMVGGTLLATGSLASRKRRNGIPSCSRLRAERRLTATRAAQS